MKSSVVFAAIVGAASTVLVNSLDSQQEFTVVGTYISDGSSEYQSS